MRYGVATALVGIAVAGLALSLAGRIGDVILGPLVLAAGMVAVAGLAFAGYVYSRRSGAELITRGTWSGGVRGRDRSEPGRAGEPDDGTLP